MLAVVQSWMGYRNNQTSHLMFIYVYDKFRDIYGIWADLNIKGMPRLCLGASGYLKQRSISFLLTSAVNSLKLTLESKIGMSAMGGKPTFDTAGGMERSTLHLKLLT